MPTSAAARPAANGASKPGFAHLDTWIFDLDNTLYPSEANLLPRMEERVMYFLCRLFGLDGLSAFALHRWYYQRYGSTLRGLMEDHSLDPADFLEFIHEVDLSCLSPDEALAAAIAALPGRKLILTNGSRRHAERVSERLGIRDHFEAIFDIADGRFVSKPHREAYRRFIDRHAVNPHSAAIFEDMAPNLVVPHELGFVTVLVVPRPESEGTAGLRETPAHVHHRTPDLAGFLVACAER